jgi:hypothetical protein
VKSAQAAALLLVVALAGGCGDDADTSTSEARGSAAQEDAIRAVVDEANSSFAEGDYARTCRQYTRRAQRAVIASTSAETCTQAWQRVASVMRESMTDAQFKATTEYGVETVRIQGDSATAVYGDPPPEIRDLAGIEAGEQIGLRLVDGVWRIDSLPTP